MIIPFVLNQKLSVTDVNGIVVKCHEFLNVIQFRTLRDLFNIHDMRCIHFSHSMIVVLFGEFRDGRQFETAWRTTRRIEDVQDGRRRYRGDHRRARNSKHNWHAPLVKTSNEITRMRS